MNRCSFRDTANERVTLPMRFEREFVTAGGLLMAGCDPAKLIQPVTGLLGLR
jgi:hypothetical protein